MIDKTMNRISTILMMVVGLGVSSCSTVDHYCEVEGDGNGFCLFYGTRAGLTLTCGSIEITRKDNRCMKVDSLAPHMKSFFEEDKEGIYFCSLEVPIRCAQTAGIWSTSKMTFFIPDMDKLCASPEGYIPEQWSDYCDLSFVQRN